ncbi:MAG TPA: aldo/keto reductase [Candidatus Eisenbacteria bacterium]|uniref:Aldo/keto reductase n=1 Tax=Eiseniibacteriota bacterium TaxID=2212470 RepID=A0A7V2AWB0_UNCEI|nr:aldo/keto reductase [Candidatus Eisenbacteria bacterium]
MNKRRVGRTELSVSEISFGAWQLGNDESWERIDRGAAKGLVHAALDAGVNLFDTAPNYGGGESERLLGEALAGRRGEVVLVSKFGHRVDGPKDFSVERFDERLGASLERLKTDHLDVLLLHNPPVEIYEGTDPIWERLEKAQRAGKIRHYGASLDFAAEAEACLENTGSEVLEVFFNILHQDIRKAFPLVREKGTGIIAKIPLDSGWLTGKYTAESRFVGVRSRWSREDIARRAELVSKIDWLTADGTELACKAIAYLLSYREVSCVIPGIRTLEHLRRNIEAADCPITAKDRQRLESFWEEFTEGGTNLLCW